MAVTQKYTCDVCDETIDKPETELATLVITRPHEEPVTSHVHAECLNEAMEGNEFLESVVLHD